MPVAPTAAELSGLANGLRLLFSLAPGRRLASDSACLARRCSGDDRTQSFSQCRGYRQSHGEDCPKRGQRGFDGGKKIKGRKQHIAVDTQGFILAVLVHSAGISDSRGSHLLISRLMAVCGTLQLIWVDGGYKAGCIAWAKWMFGITLEVVQKVAKGFQVLPKRWIVERTFAWLNMNRRLVKDYEHNPRSSEAFILIANLRTILRRIS